MARYRRALDGTTCFFTLVTYRRRPILATNRCVLRYGRLSNAFVSACPSISMRSSCYPITFIAFGHCPTAM